MAELTLILGGARSGKTARALAIARPPRVYVATAEPGDAEMAERIRRHREEREADWALIEAPLDLAAAVASAPEGTLLIDCLTLWLSNLMAAGRAPESETGRLLAAIEARAGAVVAVSNELGLGLVPMDGLSRQYRDAHGRMNQQVAAAADHVEFVAAGLPLKLK